MKHYDGISFWRREYSYCGSLFQLKGRLFFDLDSSSKLVNWRIALQDVVLSELLILESINDRPVASNEIILANTCLWAIAALEIHSC